MGQAFGINFWYVFILQKKSSKISQEKRGWSDDGFFHVRPDWCPCAVICKGIGAPQEVGHCQSHESIVPANQIGRIDAGAQSIVSVSGWWARRWCTTLKSKRVLHFQGGAPRNRRQFYTLKVVHHESVELLLIFGSSTLKMQNCFTFYRSSSIRLKKRKSTNQPTN